MNRQSLCVWYALIGCCLAQYVPAQPPSQSQDARDVNVGDNNIVVDHVSDGSECIDKSSDKVAGRPARKFVRKWKLKELSSSLHLVGRGRSFENGQKLFATASCDKCHRFNQVGGTSGPDITGVAKRNSRVAILREILEPSYRIMENYESYQVVTTTGRMHHGDIVRQNTQTLWLSTDPNDPEQLLEIPLADVEEMIPSTVSIMPTGLLDTLTKQEIFDLLAYIDSGGKEDHPAFESPRKVAD